MCFAGVAKQLRADMGGSPDSGSLPSAMNHGSAAWEQAKSRFEQLATDIEAALGDAESAHEGRAADAANASINEIVPHARAASETAGAVSKALANQATTQNSTFHEIPGEGETLSNGRPVQLDPPEKGWVDDYDDTWYLGWASDYEERQEDFQLTNDRATEVQERYKRETEANLAAVPEFQPMPGEPANATPVGATTPSAQSAMGSSQFSSLSSGGGAPAGSSSSWASSPVSGGGAPSLGGGSGGAGAPPAGSGSAWAPAPPSGGLPPGVVRGPDGTLYRQNPRTGAWERQNPHNGRWAPSPGGGPGGAAGGRGAGGSAGGAGGRAGGLGAGAGAGAGSGAGGRAGVGGLGGAGGGASAAGGAGAAGRGGAGAPGAGMGGAGQRGGQQGEDAERERPSWLIEEEDVFTNDMRAVAPPVFGDWENQDR